MMRQLKRFLSTLTVLPLVLSFWGCAEIITESGESQGTGQSWTFNVTNHSEVTVELVLTPLREKPGLQRVDGPIVSKSLEPGATATLRTRTGTPGFSEPKVRTFLLEIHHLNPTVVSAAGWPQSMSTDLSLNLYGLGWVDVDEVYQATYLSDLAPGEYLYSAGVYNVTIGSDKSMDWSLDPSVLTAPLP